jgi:hypothetical protein
MVYYRLAGWDVGFPGPLPELGSYEISGIEPGMPVVLKSTPAPQRLTCRTIGWVGGEERQVVNWSAPPGILLRVTGGSDFYILPGGLGFVRVDKAEMAEQKSTAPLAPLTGLDLEILLGPAIVLALALRGTWCLHASAALFKHHLVAFLGESGEGKSTLAAYLAEAGEPDWRRVADDILPVTANANGVGAWPHFPQRKLPMQAQPGPDLPERLPLDCICVLTPANVEDRPELQRLTSAQAMQTFLGHTAGARLFDTSLLAEHLAFCAQAAEQVPVYRLIYPHRKDALPEVMELLEYAVG